MADDITNKMLLEHMQGMKEALQEQITGLGGNIVSLGMEMRQGFSDTQKDIQALQEDLVATMLMLDKHSTKLARL